MYSIYVETLTKTSREIATPVDGSHNDNISKEKVAVDKDTTGNNNIEELGLTTIQQRPKQHKNISSETDEAVDKDFLVKENYAAAKGTVHHVGDNGTHTEITAGHRIQEPTHQHQQRKQGRNQDPQQMPVPSPPRGEAAEIRTNNITQSATNTTTTQTLTTQEHNQNTTTVDEEGQTPIDAYLAGTSSSQEQRRHHHNPDLVVEGKIETTKKWYERPWVMMTGAISCVLLLLVALVVGLVFGLNREESQDSQGGEIVDDDETSQPSPMSSSSSPTIIFRTNDPTPSPTELPTMSMAPTTIQFSFIEAQVATEFPNLVDSEEGEGSRNGPRYKASLWMERENDFDLPIPMNNVEERRTFRERYALAVFYYSTDGDGDGGGGGESDGTAGWRDQCNFLSTSDVCNWQCNVPEELISNVDNVTNQQLFDEYEPYDDYFVNGAFANPETSMGVFCNTDGAVTRLGFVSNNLHGTIPLEIGGLSSLTDLALPANHLIGTIPFGVLGDLLGNNAVPGGLRLPFNELHGTIPYGLRSDGLAYLTTLNLKYNQLSGTIPPQVYQLDLLGTLFLRSNLLTGNLPDTPPVWVLSLIDLTSNLLTSTLPVTWFSAGTINRLELSSNLFEGTIPDFPPTETSRVMEFLEVGDNFLSGTIPNSIGNANGLWKIDLHENQLVGSLPVSMGSLTKLYELNVGNNSLTGDIETFFSKSSLFGNSCIGASLLSCALGTLQMYGNEFRGSVAANFGENVMIVYLHGNQLSGRIPTQIGQLSNLFKLTLDDNQLTGPVPEEIGFLNLSQLTLQHNQLTGNLDSLCQASASDGYNWANNCFDLEINFGFEVDCVVSCECCSLCCDADGVCRENPDIT